MKTAAIYCRVSTEDQEREGTSLDSQKEACLAKAKELGYDVPDNYRFIEVWTGADTDRPGLNELRSLVKHRLIDSVICYSTDRLARNPIHIAIIAEECDKRDVDLVFVTEPLDNSPEGQLIRYVKGYAAQVEREKIRERTMRGKRAKAREGRLSTGGARLFGYDFADGKRIINQEESAIVQRIFNWFAYDGYTLYRAAAELNNAGIEGPRGGKWTEHTLHRLLNNPAYKGVTYAFRYFVVEPKQPKKKCPYPKTTHKFRDKAEWIEIPGATPAIVSPEVFEAAQRQLQINRERSPRRRKNQYLFTNGRLRCGTCGRSMIGTCKKKPKGDWRLYRCISNVKSNYYERCTQPGVAADRIEALVWDKIAQILQNPGLVISELERQRKKSIPATLEAEEILIESNIRKAKEEELRYLRKYGQGQFTDEQLDAEVARVRRYREAEEVKLAEIKKRRKALEEADIRFNKLSEVLATLAERLNKADHELKQLALEALDIKVTIQPNGDIHISGTIPSEVQQPLTKSPPFIMAPPGMTPPCWKR